jgi:hypothetical protein
MSSPRINLTRCEIRYVPAAKMGEVYMKANLGLPEGFLGISEMEFVDSAGMNAIHRSANHPKNLETIYRAYQRIDDTPGERAHQLDQRSMTMGDAIVIDGRAYYVASSGFVFKDAGGNIVELTEDNYDVAA